MFETLSKGFKSAKQRLQGKRELTEDNIDEALRDIRMSLLEADVEYKVAKRFIARVKEKSIGEVVKVKVKHKGRRMHVNPGDHFIKICHEELESLMGPVDTELKASSIPPTKIMMVGLQGSGKTTTAAKLSKMILDQGGKPMLVAADVYRPAAITQLEVLGKSLQVPVVAEVGGDPIDICNRATEIARQQGYTHVIFDTAGRLAVDDVLMTELEEIVNLTKPENIFLVTDAMIGQDAVTTAKEFSGRLPLTGFIMTKLDGDARGGAALSIKEVTGVPIKYIGMGEGLDKLEEFRPDGLASRILGFGDIVGLMQDFEKVVDEEAAEEDARRMLSGKFNFTDFIEQIRIIKQMGSLTDLIDKMPFFSGGLPEGVKIDDNELVKIESMISSMTKKERIQPDLLKEESRQRRVARGAGRKLDDVRELVQKFEMMRGMMGQLGAMGGGFLDKLPGFKQFRQIQKMRGLDLGELFGDMKGMGMPPGMPGAPKQGETIAALPSGAPRGARLAARGYTPPGSASAGQRKKLSADLRSKRKTKRKAQRKSRKGK